MKAMSRRLPDFTDHRTAVRAAGGELYHHYQGGRAHYVFRLGDVREAGACADTEADLVRVASSFCSRVGVTVTARTLPVIDGFEVDEYGRRIIPANIVLAPGDARRFDRWRHGLLSPETVLTYWRHARDGKCTNGWILSGQWWFVCGDCHPAD
jgi:hypothetical protein